MTQERLANMLGVMLLANHLLVVVRDRMKTYGFYMKCLVFLMLLATLSLTTCEKVTNRNC